MRCDVMTQHQQTHTRARTRVHVNAFLNVNYIIIFIKYIFHQIELVSLDFFSFLVYNKD